jgi:anti-sigma B factor antagonist
MIHGEIDLSTAKRFAATARAALESGATTILLDLSDVGFMDSAGLAALVEIRGAARRLDVTLRLGSPSKIVARTMQIANLYQLFEVEAKT